MRTAAGQPAAVLVWFHRDLRLADNPALTAAVASGRPVVPVYVHDDDGHDDDGHGGGGHGGGGRDGAAARWWLHHSLMALSQSLGILGTPLVVRRGSVPAVLDALVHETGADTLHFNQTAEPWASEREERIAGQLGRRGLAVHAHAAALLFRPQALRTRAGGQFKVFTAFWRTCLELPELPHPLPAPARLRGLDAPVAGDDIQALGLLPHGVDWAGGLREAWTPGERGAWQRLSGFLDGDRLETYEGDRDRPDKEGTSRLSPHLAFGEISVGAVWHAVRAKDSWGSGVSRFLTELGWREFCHYLLHHHPDMAQRPLRPEFNRFPWRNDATAVAAWRRGRTGYPIVDAGMRQLWRTGWMHNRVRMVTASFLVKHLLCPWQEGERWFRDTLVDADAANNAAGWQWVAGCGADAAPFFRIFNPVLQGERFDPDGAYVRRYVPELAEMPARWIHKPWLAPPAALAAAGVRLGTDYPLPLVDHGRARAAALAAFKSVSGPGRSDEGGG
jgi:deoxyribodipyrimidine photo-lyase